MNFELWRTDLDVPIFIDLCLLELFGRENDCFNLMRMTLGP